MRASIEELTYTEAQRGLALQPVLLNELRARTGILLAVTTATTSFLGAVAIDRGGLSGWGVLGIASFVIAAACSVAVLWPRKWTFFPSATSMLVNYRDMPHPESGEPWTAEQAHADLALHMEHHADCAINQMNGMQKLFTAAAVSLGVEVACWLIEYGT